MLMKRNAKTEAIILSKKFDRERFIRPRATIFKDKSKNSRQKDKLQVNRDWSEAEYESTLERLEV